MVKCLTRNHGTARRGTGCKMYHQRANTEPAGMYGEEAGRLGSAVAICNYYDYMIMMIRWAGYVVINRYVVSGALASNL
jgi:hypothetical protein